MEAMKEARFQKAQWISDPSYTFESPDSPVPFVFQKTFACPREAVKATVQITAFGIYEGELNGQRISETYFAPGFTSYEHILQVQTYDLTSLVSGGVNVLRFTVAGGWAVGRSTYVEETNHSFSKIAADAPTLLAELCITYADGSEEIVATDDTWQVTEEGPVRFADWYDGETMDARVDLQSDSPCWKPASVVTPRLRPMLALQYGLPVTAHERFEGKRLFFDDKNSEWIYDFGQNFAGVLELRVRGTKGQTIRVRHAEVLMQYAKNCKTPSDPVESAAGAARTTGEEAIPAAPEEVKSFACGSEGPGELYVQNLRSAKQLLTCICIDGEQTFSPRLTYMGFRYIGISGIAPEDILSVTGVAVYSDLPVTGTFACSNEDLNRLQKNIEWSSKSNLVDIPTDCPQRDERQGWTGDIALFANTACFNFDMSAFLSKWLLDQKYEQGEHGEIPFVIPRRPGHTPEMVTSGWGDSCIMVPWALYQSEGDADVLKRQYPVMQRYMDTVQQLAALSEEEYKTPYIWKHPFHFGDWCAPYGTVPDWLARGPWVGTAYWSYTCRLMSRICGVLGETEESARYAQLSENISRAWYQVFTGEDGLLKEEFQAGYVVPLAFGMGTKDQRARLAKRLAEMIRENGGALNTGFQATPYILFALCDNGQEQAAFDLLMQEEGACWLYQIRRGATTFWEQWQSIEPDGNIRESSFNHYAYGSVGDFFYRRICGLEPEEAGYQRFLVKPVLGGGLTWAECTHRCPYGDIRVRWELGDSKKLQISVTVPEQTVCRLVLPDGKEELLEAGMHERRADL